MLRIKTCHPGHEIEQVFPSCTLSVSLILLLWRVGQHTFLKGLHDLEEGKVGIWQERKEQLDKNAYECEAQKSLDPQSELGHCITRQQMFHTTNCSIFLLSVKKPVRPQQIMTWSTSKCASHACAAGGNADTRLNHKQGWSYPITADKLIAVRYGTNQRGWGRSGIQVIILKWPGRIIPGWGYFWNIEFEVACESFTHYQYL